MGVGIEEEGTSLRIALGTGRLTIPVLFPTLSSLLEKVELMFGVGRAATCSKYLCPGTLACVDKPTHCPCAWEDTMVKAELHGDWGAVCVSKGGKPGIAERKVELARKGLL